MPRLRNVSSEHEIARGHAGGIIDDDILRLNPLGLVGSLLVVHERNENHPRGVLKSGDAFWRGNHQRRRSLSLRQDCCEA